MKLLPFLLIVADDFGGEPDVYGTYDTYKEALSEAAEFLDPEELMDLVEDGSAPSSGTFSFFKIVELKK
jgi:hypothetical protein